jgi:hypothetical protein
LTTQLPQIVTIVKPFRSFLATAEEKYAVTIERRLPAHAWWRPVAANLLPAMPVPYPCVTEIARGASTLIG